MIYTDDGAPLIPALALWLVEHHVHPLRVQTAHMAPDDERDLRILMTGMLPAITLPPGTTWMSTRVSTDDPTQ